MRPERGLTRPGRILALGLITACGAAPAPPAPAPEAPAPSPAPAAPWPDNAALAPTGLPGMGPHALLILVGPETEELEALGAAYACTALGWRVSLTAPALPGLRGRHGASLPADVAVADLLKPGSEAVSRFTALLVPTGAPTDAGAAALVARFGNATGRLLAATEGGRLALPGPPPGATRDEGIALRGDLVLAARPGDLPALCHALDAIAEDRGLR